uniref:Uncharacterized protein n=1 Tax=Oryza barthii TaxID=65489 RepID=A0A0D3FD99_9ORYZ
MLSRWTKEVPSPGRGLALPAASAVGFVLLSGQIHFELGPSSSQLKATITGVAVVSLLLAKSPRPPIEEGGADGGKSQPPVEEGVAYRGCGGGNRRFWLLRNPIVRVRRLGVPNAASGGLLGTAPAGERD